MSNNFIMRALEGRNSGGGKNGAPPPSDQDIRRTNRFFVTFLLISLVFVLSHKYNNPAVYISTALMWLMSCLASGAAVGFLFGIPKIYQGNSTAVERAPNVQQSQQPAAGPPPAGARAGSASPGRAIDYRQEVNTNLTEISDWLTKIIVGLGLINLAQIPAYLDRMANSLAGGLNPTVPQEEKSFAFALITCFSVFGFLFSYIYTRVFLSVLFSRSDQAALSRVSEQAEQANTTAEEAKVAAENAQTAALGVGKAEGHRALTARGIVAQGDAPGDPWKGQFGGDSKSGNRRLEAEVTPALSSVGLYSVRLRVFSTKPDEDPLRGTVQFFLHPTFANDRPTVTVGPKGVAELLLTAWGAFTVGALADDGRARLELDLAQLESAPEEFRNR